MARIVTGRRMVVRDAEDCINFDGGRIDVSPCPNFNITEFSISFWANTFVQGGAYSGYRDWVSFNGASGGIGSIEIFNSPDPKGSVNFAKISGFTGANNVNGSKNVIGTGWRRITMTASKTDNAAKIYIDGVLEASAAWNPSSEVITSFRVGARINDSNRSIKAMMTHIRVYNRRLSASEVLDEHYSEIIQRSNLAMELLLQEASGTTVNDTSGNSIVGTINASVASWSLLGPMKLRTAASSRINVNAQYIPNPYMDDDDGTGKPAGWTSYQSGDGDSVFTRSIDRVNFVTGTGSHKITLYAPSGTYRNNWTFINLIAILPTNFVRSGNLIRVFVRYKTSTGTYCFIGFSSSAVARKIAESSSQTVWTEVTTDVVFAKPVTALDLQLQCKNKNTTDTAILWVDEIRITHIPRTAV